MMWETASTSESHRDRRIRRLVLVGFLVGVAACGGGDSTSDVTSASLPATAPASAPLVDDSAGGAVSSVSDVKTATVQVLAAGSFRDPLAGDVTGEWSGSGFLIDPAGIIVTNNHVVTGAGLLKVRIGGSDEEIPARVLGVSECNDLAVIELIDPGPYPYLEWYTDEVEPPLEVYTAGFPLGDPEFTITRGVVSKAKADGNSSWASVRHVIEHDANIQPGNSGGPLVTAEGRVVGVNYAGGDPGTGTSQFFAIAADLAGPVVERLRNGDDETIGVNGQAVVSDDGSLAGVWVAAVEPGSPATNTGILSGDIINTLNGVPMSPGTMESYCDVLRTASANDPIAVQVIRYDTGEVWEGELNGTPMSARFSFADELAGEVPVDDSGPAYTYETVTDDTGTITVDVPSAWGDRDTQPTDFGLPSGPAPSILAAPNLSAFLDSYTNPGVAFIGVSSGASGIDPLALIGDLAATDPACSSDGPSPYSDPAFEGQLEAWVCGAALYIAVAAKPLTNPDAIVIVTIVAVTEADLDALDQILLTFDFN
jgi:serine protease Do